MAEIAQAHRMSCDVDCLRKGVAPNMAAHDLVYK